MNKKLFLVLFIIGNTYSKSGLVEEIMKANLLQTKTLLEGRIISAEVVDEMGQKTEKALHEATKESLTKKEWIELGKGAFECILGTAAVALALAASISDPDKNFGMIELTATGAVAAAGCVLAPIGGFTMQDAYNKKHSTQEFTETYAKYQLVQEVYNKNSKNSWGR